MDWKKFLREWVIPFVLEVVAVLLIIRFAVFCVRVPTGSMIPTVNENAWLVATRMYFPEKTVQRGDILAFESDELGQVLLKRVVGLPGDTVELVEGEMYVNGVYYPEEYVVNEMEFSGSWQVPDGCYLFMGDNRAGSLDARFWEEPYIPAEKLVGEVRFGLWPLSNFGILK